MNNILIDKTNFLNVITLLGGHVVLTGKDHFQMRANHLQMRELSRHGIQYIMADSPMARGL